MPTKKKWIISFVVLLSVLTLGVITDKITPVFSEEDLNTKNQEIVNFDECENSACDNVKIIYQPTEIIPPTEFDNNSISSAEYSPGLPLTGFTTSTLTNGSDEVNVSQSFTLTFDHTPSEVLLRSLKFYPSAEFSANGSTLPFTTKVNGNTITIEPHRLERSTEYIFGLELEDYTIGSSDQYAVPTNTTDGWLYALSFKTDFKETYIYGKSVEGRDLKAYGFGKNDENGKKFFLNGAVHGEEWRSGDLTQLKNYLTEHPEELEGKNKSFVIVPFVNIDGATYNKRYNMNNVNLNRNWPEYWIKDSVSGSKPASEPETKYLMDFMLEEKPTHHISYHSQWPPYGIIFLGDDYNTDTNNFAVWVANRTGYPLGIYDGFDGDPVPGDQGVWAESVGITSITIEATWKENSDWDKNWPMYLGLMRDF